MPSQSTRHRPQNEKREPMTGQVRFLIPAAPLWGCLFLAKRASAYSASGFLNILSLHLPSLCLRSRTSVFNPIELQLPDDFRSSSLLGLAPLLFRLSPIIDRKISSSFLQTMIWSSRSSSSFYLSPTGHC